MPNLHLHFYLFINRIWALLAQGATDFNNTNMVMGNRPITDLYLTHHTKAIHVLKAHLDQVSLAQSQGSPILVQASIATKYCPKSVPPGMTIPGLTIDPNPTTKLDQSTCCDTKRKPATPDSGTETTKTRSCVRRQMEISQNLTGRLWVCSTLETLR